MLLLALGCIGIKTGAGAPTARLQLGNLSGSESSANRPTLESVLASMDAAAAGFTSVVSNLEYTKVTVLVNDRSTEKGQIYFQKSKGKIRVMIAFREPAEKYVLFAGGKVSLYRPKIGQVEEYSLSQKEGLLEQFLLLGFGTAGAELQKAYRVSFGGEERLEGEPVFRLELAPKGEAIATQLQRVELWISPATGQPLQQKFFEPSEDYLIARYRDLKTNLKIPDKTFRLPLRGKVRTVRPQSGL